MFGILKTASSFLFGGASCAKEKTDTLLEVAKGVGTWIDERDFTEEEKSKANAANLEAILKAIELTNNESSTRSITRRVMAWAIMGSFLLAFWIAFIMKVGFHQDIKPILTLVDTFSLGQLALAVGSFYFVASLIRK